MEIDNLSKVNYIQCYLGNMIDRYFKKNIRLWHYHQERQ